MLIAVLPGKFDPPHIGHIEMASAVLTSHIAEEVWLTPYPMATNPVHANNNQRIRMCELMVSDCGKRIMVSNHFIKNPFYSLLNYLRNIHIEYPEHKFICIIGQDEADNYRRWPKNQVLIRFFKFIVFPRNLRIITRRKWYTRSPHELMPTSITPISSTQLRRSLNKDFMNEKVFAYIKEQDLYD